MFDLAARRQLNRGQGGALSRAVELVVTPLLFGLAGSWLDSTFDLRPALTLSFVGLAVVGLFVKMWIGYDQEMRRHEAELLARRQARLAPTRRAAPDTAPTLPDAAIATDGDGRSVRSTVVGSAGTSHNAATTNAPTPPDAAAADGGEVGAGRRREVGR